MKWSQRTKVPKHLRCEALLRDCWLRPTNDRCGCHAHVALDGRRLCHKHAQMWALELLLREKRALEVAVMVPSLRCAPRFIGDEV